MDPSVQNKGNEDDEEVLRRLHEKKKKELIRMAQPTQPTKPIEVTDETFADTIQKYPVVIVDCWAPWCGPCRMLAPVLDQLAMEMQGRVVFAKLNVDENPLVAQQFDIQSIPTLLVFKNGKYVDRVVGAMPKPMLQATLAEYL